MIRDRSNMLSLLLGAIWLHETALTGYQGRLEASRKDEAL